jgi:hypothetical protein
MPYTTGIARSNRFAREVGNSTRHFDRARHFVKTIRLSSPVRVVELGGVKSANEGASNPLRIVKAGE